MIYFDNSATTNYKPPCVVNAVKNALEFLSANPGRSGHSMSLKAAMLVQKARKATANFIDLKDSSRIIFTQNCTMALNLAICGSVKNGGNVIVTSYEHNSVLRPVFELQRMGKISVTVIRPNELGIVDEHMIERNLRPNTYMVITNHVSNVTGAVTPIFSIGKMLRKYKILYLVDGAQSVGYRRVSLVEDYVDLLAIAPHKGLHAPQGVGILAIGENAVIKPIIFGGTGTDSESLFQPNELPESLESGTLSTPCIAGVLSGINYTKKHMADSLLKLGELTIYAYEKLQKIDGVTLYNPPNPTSGIISFNIKDYMSTDVADILSDQYDICVRGGLHCAPLIHKHLNTLEKGIVRASFGIENTYSQIDQLVQAVTEIAR